jgi:2-deoxy-D-gluconate 3-dehydrogenase
LDRFSLKGKTALVTGSSRGLGAGLAIALAEAGANVAVHGARTVPKDAQQILSLLGANHFAVVGDVSDASVCSRLIEQVVQHFGTIDILINNAGIIRRAPAAEHSEEDWQAVIDTNLTGVFRLTKNAGKHMLAQGSGKVVNIASILTFQGGVCSLVRGGQGWHRATDEGIRQ